MSDYLFTTKDGQTGGLIRKVIRITKKTWIKMREAINWVMHGTSFQA